MLQPLDGRGEIPVVDKSGKAARILALGTRMPAETRWGFGNQVILGTHFTWRRQKKLDNYLSVVIVLIDAICLVLRL